MLIGVVSVTVFEMLKRGLNNNIKTIANDFVGKHIDIEDLIKL